MTTGRTRSIYIKLRDSLIVSKTEMENGLTDATTLDRVRKVFHIFDYHPETITIEDIQDMIDDLEAANDIVQGM